MSNPRKLRKEFKAEYSYLIEKHKDFLKEHHKTRLYKQLERKYIAKLNGGLNNLFDFIYGSEVEGLSAEHSPFLELIKPDTFFSGATLTIPMRFKNE